MGPHGDAQHPGRPRGHGPREARLVRVAVGVRADDSDLDSFHRNRSGASPLHSTLCQLHSLPVSYLTFLGDFMGGHSGQFCEKSSNWQIFIFERSSLAPKRNFFCKKNLFSNNFLMKNIHFYLKILYNSFYHRMEKS